jgi:hypothetical protein
MDTLAALTDQVTSAQLTPGQRRYLLARLRDPESSKRATLRLLGLSEKTFNVWRSSRPAFKELDNAIYKGSFLLAKELAGELIGQYAPLAAGNLIDLAELPATTDRQLQVKFQSNVKLLEGAGVLRSAPGVTVNVESRVDRRAIHLWQQGGADAWRERRLAPPDAPPALPEHPESDA